MKFDIIFHGIDGADFAKNRRTLVLGYGSEGSRFLYKYPLHILDDIGAAELSRRIYSVFKQHISRPAAELG